MSRREITLTEITGQFTYCRRYDNSLTAFDNYDSEALSRVGTQKPMMEQAADVMYWGAAAAFYKIGFALHTAGDYGALTWEYWNGSAWTAFTPFHESTSGFEQNGYVAWGTLASWAATTVNSQSAYWIRVTAASVTTAAQFYSFLLNITLGGPLGLPVVQDTDKYVRDVNGTLRVRDRTDIGPRELTIECTYKTYSTDSTNPASMQWPNLLAWFQANEIKLHINDEAQTATPDVHADSYYKSYTGYLAQIDPKAFPAEYKMRPGEFMLQFIVDSATGIM